MPQLEFADYAPQLVWLVITFAVLYALMARLALPRIADILDARQRRLSHDLEQAERLRDEAAAALADYEAAMAEARARAAAIVVEAREKIRQEAQRRLADLDARLEHEAKEHEAEIGAARQQAMTELRAAAVEAARAVTVKLIGVEVPEPRVGAAIDAVTQGRG